MLIASDRGTESDYRPTTLHVTVYSETQSEGTTHTVSLIPLQVGKQVHFTTTAFI